MLCKRCLPDYLLFSSLFSRLSMGLGLNQKLEDPFLYEECVTRSSSMQV